MGTNPLLYKTELCTSFQISGYCPYGTRCKFAHGSSELRPVPANYSSSAGGGRPRSALYKTELCKSFAKNGHCSYHDRCQYAHGEDELRSVIRHPKYRTQLCRSFKLNGTCRYGARCRFLHTHEETDEVKRVPWASDPAASVFSPSASSPDTKTDDSHGVIGEAKSAGSRHEQAVLSFLGIVSPKQEQKQQNTLFKFSTAGPAPQRSWADLAAGIVKPEPPPMPPPNPMQNPELNNDSTFSGLFGARWGNF